MNENVSYFIGENGQGVNILNALYHQLNGVSALVFQQDFFPHTNSVNGGLVVVTDGDELQIIVI